MNGLCQLCWFLQCGSYNSFRKTPDLEIPSAQTVSNTEEINLNSVITLQKDWVIVSFTPVKKKNGQELVRTQYCASKPMPSVICITVQYIPLFFLHNAPVDLLKEDFVWLCMSGFCASVWMERLEAESGVYYQEVLHPEGDWALEQASQGSGHNTKPDRVKRLDNALRHTVWLLGALCRARSWTRWS